MNSISKKFRKFIINPIAKSFCFTPPKAVAVSPIRVVVSDGGQEEKIKEAISYCKQSMSSVKEDNPNEVHAEAEQNSPTSILDDSPFRNKYNRKESSFHQSLAYVDNPYTASRRFEAMTLVGPVTGSKQQQNLGKRLDEPERRMSQLRHQLPSKKTTLMHLLAMEDAENKKTEFRPLFKDMKFFLSREVPREFLLFIIPAFGGSVSWEGGGAPFKETDLTITHQIAHQPVQGYKFLAREYVQPQWIFDCVKAGILLTTNEYVVGRIPPQSLLVAPDYAETIKRLLAIAKKQIVPMPVNGKESLNEHQSLLVESVINRSEVNAVAEKKQKMLELEEKHQKELEMELQRASARASSTEERLTEDEDARNELQQADIEIDEEDEEILSLDYWVDLNNQTKDTSSSRSSSSGSSKSSWGGDSEFSYTTDELPYPWRNRIGGVVKKWGTDSDGDKKEANVGENDRGRGSIEETIGPEMGSETLLAFVNFRHHRHSINVRYPLSLDPKPEALAAKGISTSLCSFCHAHDESTDHLLLNCEIARLVWFGTPAGIIFNTHESPALWDCFKAWFSHKRREDIIPWACAIIWAIWEHRNAIVCEGAKLDVESMISAAIHYYGTSHITDLEAAEFFDSQ